ncbi:MAG: ATP-binding protein, partial [Candidatus Aminicenantaceae bacterium]
SRALLSFRDEGIGMSSKEEKELFQPFLSHFKNGAGLGMAIVYQIIQQHHGKIDIQSQRNAGTVIDISLPIEH